MWAQIKCWLFHHRSVLRVPGYSGDEAQCFCGQCGLMWIENRPDLWASQWGNQSNNDHPIIKPR